jgi:hypothetical protein
MSLIHVRVCNIAKCSDTDQWCNCAAMTGFKKTAHGVFQCWDLNKTNRKTQESFRRSKDIITNLPLFPQPSQSCTPPPDRTSPRASPRVFPDPTPLDIPAHPTIMPARIPRIPRFYPRAFEPPPMHPRRGGYAWEKCEKMPGRDNLWAGDARGDDRGVWKHPGGTPRGVGGHPREMPGSMFSEVGGGCLNHI